MKVTIEPKEKKIRFEDIKPGQVFEYEDGIVALRLRFNEVILLTYSDGDTNFEVANAYKKYPIKKVLGTLTEIIVE